MKEKISPVLALLAIGCFLTPILGGQIPTDSLPLDTSALTAIIEGPSLPILQHAILALPFLAALISLLVRRRVLQVPGRTLGLTFAAFFGVIAATFPGGSFKGTSLPVTLEWLSYGVALYATVGAAGRRAGPRVLILAIFGGCSITALKGLMEYGQMKAIDPTWRIFGGWVNPNALAAMLVVGIFLGIGLTLTETRLVQLVCGLFTAVLVLATTLTKSRGALLVLALCLILLACLLAAWWAKRSSNRLAILATSLVFAALTTICLIVPVSQLAAPVSQSAIITQEQSGLGRLSGSGLSTDQSVYFRRLLWKGAVPLFRDYPTGLGMANYRYYSAKSGLTTQTELAHEGYLQLGVEATVFAPLLLVASLFLWALQVCKAPAGLPRNQNILRASVIAAIFSVLAHNLSDSDFYYFGIGLLTFVLIGIALLLSADAVAPEFTPPSLRRAGIATLFVLGVGMMFMGYVELLKDRVRYELTQGDAANATADIQTLSSLAPFDGETWYLASKIATTPREASADLQKAVQLGGSTRILRALAANQEAEGEPASAVATLNQALTLDPNNMVTLHQLMMMNQRIGSPDAIADAKRLIEVENTLYYKIRSLPDLVPTESFSARAYLADQSTSVRQKVELLMPAVRGYVEFGRKTVGLLKSQQGGPSDAGGLTLATAVQKLRDEAIPLAKEAQRDAVATGDRADAAEAAKAADVLAAILSRAESSSK